jgi:hypothetical protein
MTINTKLLFKRSLPIVIGGFIGYVYYYFIGCNNGCLIQSNPLISTIYGAVLGGILFFPSKKEKQQ